MEGEQPSSKRPSARGSLPTAAAGPVRDSAYQPSALLLPPSLCYLCLPPVPRKVTWWTFNPRLHAAAAAQQPPSPRTELCLQQRADLVLAISEAFGDSRWREPVCDTS